MVQLELFKPAHYVHGTKYMYDKRGCRCDDCRAAASAYSRATSKQRCSRCGAPTQSKNPKPVCHSCRGVESEHRIQTWFVCESCGDRFYLPRPSPRLNANRFCSNACYGISRRTSPDQVADAYNKRASRAPGLSSSNRLKLLHKWRRQGRSCSYCEAPVTCVDHVLPLIQGGSNWEGNLTPCCHRCNARKGPLFVTEWRRRDGKAQAA